MDWKGLVKRLDLPDGFSAPTEPYDSSSRYLGCCYPALAVSGVSVHSSALLQRRAAARMNPPAGPAHQHQRAMSFPR
jgi:hypothetical protein